MGKMEVKRSYKPRKEWNWKVSIEYVPFSSPRERQRSYELFAESLVNQYRNKQKFLEEQERQGSKGLDN